VTSDEFLAVQRDLEEASRPRPKHPNGWEPGVDTARRSVTILSDDAAPPSDWSEIVRQFALDPAEWTVDESQPVQVRTWDSGDRRMFYYRAAIRPLRDATRVDLDALIARVRRAKKSPHTRSDGVERALVVAISDWQAGKDDGDGVEGLVARVERLRTAVPERIRQLKKAGVPIDRLYVCAMGDLVEGCDGHYAQQTYSVALDRRDQVKLVRRMLVDCLTSWARVVPQIVVTAVPGNHGENRRDGRSFTTFEDNDDLAIVEQVGEILGANPDAYGHVRFVLPDRDLTLTLDVAGTVVGFAHGHQARKGSGPAARIAKWWADKAVARHRIGDADVLITGHYHHLQIVQDGSRTWFQCPALDGGSRWFEEQGGSTTLAGTLTMTIDAAGWGNVEVLR
jgi:predicted phosphodiesterase